MCTNFAFVPLVYFCYPETADFTLEEIDSLFAVEDKSATSVAGQLRKEGKVGIERHHGSISTTNGTTLQGDDSSEKGDVQHLESA